MMDITAGGLLDTLTSLGPIVVALVAWVYSAEKRAAVERERALMAERRTRAILLQVGNLQSEDLDNGSE
jgi:hypothetical protein